MPKASEKTEAAGLTSLMGSGNLVPRPSLGTRLPCFRSASTTQRPEKSLLFQPPMLTFSG
jgi:hypothetical protein